MYYSRDRIIKRVETGIPLVYDFTRRTDPAFIPEVWDNLRDALGVAMPAVVHVWTKWPGRVVGIGGNLLKSLNNLGAILAAQVTVNGHGAPLEPRIPQDVGLGPFVDLVGGPDHVTWRFDPLIPEVPFEDRFQRVAEKITSLGIHRLVVNTIAPPGRYKRVDARLGARWEWWNPARFGLTPEQARRGRYAPTGLELTMPDTWTPWARWQHEVVSRIVELAALFGLDVHPCAETAWLTGIVDGLATAGCASPEWFASLGAPTMPVRPTRPGCGCADTVDVGSYGHWARCGACLYCYAG